MIGDDRIALNERFIQVFNELERLGRVVKNDRGGKGMGDFAEKILGKRAYGHIIRAFLTPDMKRVIDYKHIEPLCEHYNVNRAFMLHGRKPMFVQPGEEGGKPVNEVSIPLGAAGNITYTSVAGLAGSGVDAVGPAREELSYFTIPGVRGENLVALSVEGVSMQPLLNPGEIVICEPILNPARIRDNEICVVSVDGTVWIKYVKTFKDNAGRVSQLKLISENKLEYDPFVVDVNEATRVYRVIRRISEL